MTPADWPAVCDIFREGIATGIASFETEVPEWERWDAAHLAEPRLVARRGHAVLAWAALSPVSTRWCYRGVAEVSIYVAAAARGAGVGRALLQALAAASERAGLWTLQATVFADNTASLALHAKCGFRVVGRRERIAERDGLWRDTVLLERRAG